MLRKCAAGNPGCGRGGGGGGLEADTSSVWGAQRCPGPTRASLKASWLGRALEEKPGPWEGPKRPPEPPLPPPAWILLPVPQNLPGGTFPVGTVTNRGSPRIAVSPWAVGLSSVHRSGALPWEGLVWSTLLSPTVGPEAALDLPTAAHTITGGLGTRGSLLSQARWEKSTQEGSRAAKSRFLSLFVLLRQAWVRDLSAPLG